MLVKVLNRWSKDGIAARVSLINKLSLKQKLTSISKKKKQKKHDTLSEAAVYISIVNFDPLPHHN